MRKERPGIYVEYSGLHAQNIKWNLRRLELHGQFSDLRADVSIYSNSNRGERTDVPMGEVVGVKRSLRLRRTGESDLYSVRYNSDYGKAEITVFDQRLRQELNERSSGEVSQEEYVRKLDHVVHDGMQEVVKFEKSHMLRYSTLKLLSYTIGPLLTGVVAAGSFGIAKGLFEYGTITTFEFGLAPAYLAFMNTMFTAVQIITNYYDYKRDVSTGDRYLQGFTDLIPFKHIATRLTGRLFHDFPLRYVKPKR